ncbi:hypothetical protein EV188_11467 [Actinomycetospora succinea]|uniref:Uncharacterized protein n=1 Tax=Actinomycetospora succinea TaxID=663603 RepID=A0A4R6UN11_9PSEU|nr:hypothetical protein [Actinomycetospora succinea]TDQ46979.1 hypothetical protein EV188_11467 [Actinomycetospora succinea]
MTTTTREPLSQRDRAVLRAVAGGRCRRSGEIGMTLMVDGVYCSDQQVGLRLAAAGFIATEAGRGTATITDVGRAALAAA